MSVLEDVRRRLATDRAAGVAFDEAWPRAVTDAGASWAEALQSTRDTWEAAYTRGACTTGERTAVMLSAVRAINEMRDERTVAAERRRRRVPQHRLIA